MKISCEIIQDLLPLYCDGVCSQDSKQVVEAAAAWKKGKTRAFMKGCLFALLFIAVLVVGYCSFHWFSTADKSDLDALVQQAADYLGYDELLIEKVEQRGSYLATLCKDTNGNWCMCVFERDRLFENRWRADGGKSGIQDGTISSWNYGSPQNEAVLIFCGGNIPNEVCWYEFQNSNINGYPILLDCNQQEME